MKENCRTFFLKLFTCLPILLGLAPIYLIIGMNYIPGQPFLWLMPVLLAYAWAFIAYFLKGRLRGAFTLLGLIPMGLLAAFVYLPHEIGALVPLACGIGVLLYLPTVFPNALWNEWPSGFWVASIIIALIGQIVVGYEPFTALSLPLKGSFVLLMLTYFLMMNYTSLRVANHGREKPQAAMTRRNRFLTLILFIPALVISCWGPIGDLLSRLWDRLADGLAWLIKLLMGTPEVQNGEGGAPTGGGLGGIIEEGAETGEFWVFLEKVLYIIAFIIAAGILVFIIWFLWKRLMRVIRFLLAKMRAYQDIAAEDYTDEVETTTDWDERAEQLRNRVRNMFRRSPGKTPWEQLDGQGKIRRLYEQWAEKHHPASALTAREALIEHSGSEAQRFADLYDAARYGEKDIAGEQAEAIRQSIKDMH